MRKIFLIAFHRLIQTAASRAYWGNLAAPLLLSFLGLGLGAFEAWAVAQPPVAVSQPSTAPTPKAVTLSSVSLTLFNAFRFTWAPFGEAVGYVDEAGLFRYLPRTATPGKFIPFATPAEARVAVEAGHIAGYYVIPADYLAGAEAAYYTPILTDAPGTDLAIQSMLIANLSQAPDAAHATRVANPAVIRVRRANAPPGAEYALWQTVIKSFVMSSLFMVLFQIAQATAPYWVFFLQNRREQPVRELLLTSVSAGQFVAGKLLAAAMLSGLETLAPLLSLGVANAAWRLVQPTLLRLGGSLADLVPAAPAIPPHQAAVILALVAGGLFVYNALLVIAGVLVRSPEEAGAATSNFILLWLVLYFGLMATVVYPNETLALTLSLVPLASAFFMPVRLLTGPVPPWQVALSLGLTLTTIFLSLGLAVHLFRIKQHRWGLV